MMEFLAMGGYAKWVWSAFGVTTAVMVLNVIAARRRYHRALERVRLAAARRQRSAQK